MPMIDCLYHKTVTHIGHFSGPENRKPSLDGPGISVTTTPESWRAIAGLNGPEYQLSFSAAQWVDPMTFSDQDIDEIRRWALMDANKYIQEVTAWHAPVEQGGSFHHRAFASREEAARAVGRSLAEEEAAEAQGEAATWQEATYMITKRGMKVLERWPSPFWEWEQAVIALYVRKVVIVKRPYVVGVWWSEPDRPDAGCAPSGYIFPERLHHFEVEDEEGEVMSFAEMFPELTLPEDPFLGSE